MARALGDHEDASAAVKEPHDVIHEMNRYFIVGHYGGCNLGDDLMLKGLLTLLAESGAQEITVIAGDTGVVQRQLGDQGRAVSATAREVFRALRSSDVVVLGGGTHFADSYRPVMRRVRHYRYLARYLVLFVGARLLGKRVVMLGMGFGPLRSRLIRLLTRAAVGLSNAGTVRDSASLAEIERWNRRGRFQLAPDLAAAAFIIGTKWAQGESSDLTVGVSVTPMLGPIIGHAEARDVWMAVFEAIEVVYRRWPKSNWRVVVFRGGQREDDHRLSLDLVDRLRAVDPSRVELVNYDPDPSMMIDAVRDCRCWIATRFHAAVVAYLTGARFLFIPYDRKVVDLAQEVGAQPENVLPLDRTVSREEVTRRLEELLDGSEPLMPKRDPRDYVSGLDRHLAALAGEG